MSKTYEIADRLMEVNRPNGLRLLLGSLFTYSVPAAERLRSLGDRPKRYRIMTEQTLKGALRQ